MPRDWNAHYLDPANHKPDPDPFLVQLADHLPPGRALDLACGAGRHALYLARLGWDVTAVDASSVAISRLQNIPNLHASCLDLEAGPYPIPPHSYDLILNLFYLQRSLFPAIREGVAPGGAVACAILLAQPGRTPAFTMSPGELRHEFASWKISYYSEAGAVARLIARRA